MAVVTKNFSITPNEQVGAEKDQIREQTSSAFSNQIILALTELGIERVFNLLFTWPTPWMNLVWKSICRGLQRCFLGHYPCYGRHSLHVPKTPARQRQSLLNT